MSKQVWIDKTVEEMKKRFHGEGSGHDWWHIYRVWQMAKRLQATEGGDPLIIELAALLHDIADWKFADGDDLAGGKAAHEWLTSIGPGENHIAHICDIIDHVSYKGANVPTPMSTLEGKIVQDADRLDAIGAIGVARTFAYGGSKGRMLHDPYADYSLKESAKAYKAGCKTSLHHFYNKLFLIKDRLNTQAAKSIAAGRHAFLQVYAEQFLEEWAAHR